MSGLGFESGYPKESHSLSFSGTLGIQTTGPQTNVINQWLYLTKMPGEKKIAELDFFKYFQDFCLDLRSPNLDMCQGQSTPLHCKMVPYPSLNNGNPHNGLV